MRHGAVLQELSDLEGYDMQQRMLHEQNGLPVSAVLDRCAGRVCVESQIHGHFEHGSI